MENSEALKILATLANGTHPDTGEIFPADSPYQSPNVIRAPYTVCRGLEALVSSPRERNSKSDTAPRHPATGNAGKPWSSDEDRQLLAGFDSGKPIAELVQAHGRTQGGIRARLEKHGRLEPSPAARWPVNGAKPSANRAVNSG